jgi:hypothetical protein
VPVFLRTVIASLVLLTLPAGATAVSAERLEQAATATPTPTSGAAPTPVPCTTPPSGIQIVLENPQPGDTLLTGTQVVINGIAYDTRATTGSGIASVTVYLGARDQGGLALGTALLGQPNPSAPAGSQFANAGFTLRTPALPSGSGARTIFVYARSILDNSEGVLQVPVFLNTAPTPVRGQVPTPVLPPPPVCTPTPTPSATPSATSTSTSTPAAAAAVATPPTSTPVAGLAATPTPITAPAPLAPAPVSTATPTPAAAAPVAPVATVAPATAQTTAPRGGGIPTELGLLLLGAGAAIVGGGMALRRKRR